MGETKKPGRSHKRFWPIGPCLPGAVSCWLPDSSIVFSNESTWIGLYPHEVKKWLLDYFKGISDTTSHEIHSVEEKQPTVDSATAIALNAGYLEP